MDKAAIEGVSKPFQSGRFFEFRYLRDPGEEVCLNFVAINLVPLESNTPRSVTVACRRFHQSSMVLGRITSVVTGGCEP